MIAVRKRKALSNSKIIGFDTECTGLNSWGGDRPFAFSFADLEGNTLYEEFPVNPYTREVLYRENPFGFKRVKGLLEDESITKVMHNAKHDVRMCEKAGIKFAGRIEESELALKCTGLSLFSHGLKWACNYFDLMNSSDEKLLYDATKKLRDRAKRLGWKVATDESHGKGHAHADYWLIAQADQLMVEGVKTLKTWQKASDSIQERMLDEAKTKADEWIDACEEYAVNDAIRTLMLYYFAKEMLERENLYNIYEEEVRDIWPVIYRMEERGVCLDKAKCKRGSGIVKRQASKAYKELEKHTWPGFNPGSSPQKIKLFVDQLGCEPLSYTKTGNPQTDKIFLEHYASEGIDAARLVREHEKASKAQSTYFDNYFRYGLADEGKDWLIIHCNFLQAGARTFRFSCRNPNFQNVPKRGKPGDIMLLVRWPFRPRPEHVWYLGDYGQVEARIFAEDANEPVLLDAFNSGRDPYQELASQLALASGFEVERFDAKQIFLGKLYGMGAKRLARRMAEANPERLLTEQSCRQMLMAFDEHFEGVADYMAETQREARLNGYITNIYGQRIAVPPDEDYKGVNYKIQSAAARLMKRGMVKCYRFLQEIGYGHIVMTIHDELIFEFHKAKRPIWVLKELKRLMEDNDGVFTKVKTPVDFDKCTTTWLKKVECHWAMVT